MNRRRDHERPGLTLRVLARAVPVAAAMGVAYGLARFAPYWVVGVDRRLWWFGVLAIANTCLVLGDMLRGRLMRQRLERRAAGDRSGSPS